MKHFIFSLLLLTGSCIIYAQVPQGFNYQAIARDASGNPIAGAPIEVKIGILSDTITPVVVREELFQNIKTNAFGLFTVIIGTGTYQSGSTVNFSAINWTAKPLYVRAYINYPIGTWKYMGSAKLWSVPYSIIAKDLGGAVSKLKVSGSEAAMDSALFEVRNKNGQIVFAVYNEGVRVYVDDGVAKATTKGGFAIGSLNPTKTGYQDFFVVTKDSIRAYIDTGLVKARKGGFAIGSFNGAKAGTQEYFRVTRDSTRIYIDDHVSKAVKGGFAIGGFGTSKGSNTRYLMVNHDSTRIITADTLKGFGVGNLRSGSTQGYLKLTPGNYLIGHEAGKGITTGLYNSALGYQSGYSLLNGFSNSFMGYKAGRATTSGTGNVFIGYLAGYINTTGNFNVFLGHQAGYNSNGEYNLFLGYQAGLNNQTGDRNAFLGTFAGLGNTTGSYNVCIGESAGYSNSTGGSNVFIGNATGRSNTTGNYNTFMGESAGHNEKDGYSNIFIGSECGYSNVSGRNNTFLGGWTGYSNTGSSNVMIGTQAGVNNLNGSGNLFIGYMAGYSETGSNKLYIANSATNPPLIYGDFSTGTVSLGTITPSTSYKLYVNGSAYATGTWSSSDIRWKKNINPINDEISKIMMMQPVSYNWRKEEYPSINFEDGRQIGLIAQDVEKLYPELVRTDENGYKAVSYEKLSVILISGMQEQQKQIELQKKEIDELKTLVNSLIDAQPSRGTR